MQPAVPWRFHNKAGRASSAQRACSRKALPPRDHIELLPYRQIPFFGPSPKGNSDEPEEREVLSPCLINPCVCGTTFAKAAIPRHFLSLFQYLNRIPIQKFFSVQRIRKKPSSVLYSTSDDHAVRRRPIGGRKKRRWAPRGLFSPPGFFRILGPEKNFTFEY